ncbi:MAG: NADH-quinone oxidoreductase subunit 5 family protein [Nocardioidaceae bacterium]
MTAVLVICLPALAAVSALVIGHRSHRAPAIVAIAATSAAFVLTVLLCVQHLGAASAGTVGPARLETGGIAISVALRLDPLSCSMLLLVTVVALLVQVYSVAYLRGDPRYPSYASLVALFTSAMALVVAADDLFMLLVGWEVIGVCSYFLISHHWELEAAQAGAVKALVVTRLGDVGLLFGIFVAGHAAGSYRISAVVAAAADGRISQGQATLAGLLLLCGVVGKSAQFPLHSWLPDAMPGPTPITALIHAATMVAAGVYLVARLLPLFVLSSVAMDVLAVIAVVTMLIGAAFALAADDLKRVLAWSTVSQLAYMFAALSLGGLGPGVLHLLSHGAFKALLFLCAGSVIHAVGTQRLDSMGGLRRAMPVTFVTATLGFAALAGVPPLVGFFSKDAVLGLAGQQAFSGHPSARSWLVLVVGLVVAGLTAAYATRCWLLVFFGRSRSDVAEPRESPPLMVGPLVVLAAVVVFGGAAVVWPGFLGVGAEPVQWGVLGVSLLVIAVSIAVTWAEWWRLEGRDPAQSLGWLRRPLERELGYDGLVDRAVVRPAWFASGATMAAETYVVEPYAAGGDAAAQLSSRLLRWLQNGNLQRYVTVIAVGAVAVAVVVGAVA